MRGCGSALSFFLFFPLLLLVNVLMPMMSSGKTMMNDDCCCPSVYLTTWVHCRLSAVEAEAGEDREGEGEEAVGEGEAPGAVSHDDFDDVKCEDDYDLTVVRMYYLNLQISYLLLRLVSVNAGRHRKLSLGAAL